MSSPNFDKRRLGKGLGDLLGNVKPPVSPERNTSEAAPAKVTVEVKVGPGLGTLLNGSKAEEISPNGQTKNVSDKIPLIRFSLIVADLTLVFAAAVLIFNSGESPSLNDWIASTLATVVGAWLGALAFLLE